MLRQAGFVLGITVLVAISAAATSPFSSETEEKAGEPSSSSTSPVEPQETLTAKADEEAKIHTDMILLAVDKTKLTATLRTWPGDPRKSQLLKHFRIATGKVEGDKQVEGDNKTPEGIYFAQRHLVDANLPAKYGAMAIPIDFPNPMDRVHRKTGYGIWLHGVEYDQRIEEAKVTEGCVAFYNSDIAQLGSWLKPKQGVIVIAQSLDEVNRPDDVAKVRKLTENWMTAWADRNLDGYISYYDDDFRYGAHDKKSYRDYKGRVFKSYKVMKVSYDNLRVVTHPKYAVAMFNQDFHGDERFSSIGRKILYWTKDGPGQWKIRAEIFEQRRFEFLTFTDAELALLSASSSSIPSEKDPSASSL